MPATYSLNVHNIGDSRGIQPDLYDTLPNQADGGTCDVAPTQFTAQVFEANGSTAVSPVLIEGIDYTATFLGDPDCTITINMLTSAGAIGADQRLIISYQSILDLDSQQGASLTNIAGATEWFSIDVTDPNDLNYARTYSRIVTDGTVATLDHEDAHTSVVFSPLLVFDKYAVNVTSGEDPATVATPGDTIRYGLRIENTTDTPLDGFSIVDELDSLNTLPLFQAGTLNVVTLPAGADDNSDPNGGAAGTGLIDISGLKPGGHRRQLLIEFRSRADPVIADGSYVINQSAASFAGFPIAISDDPNLNGPADPNVAGDEDPTQILIQSAPCFDIDKSIDLHRRRPERAARRRDPALHDYRAKHRHRERDRRRYYGPGSREHELRCRQHDAERRCGAGRCRRRSPLIDGIQINAPAGPDARLPECCRGR